MIDVQEYTTRKLGEQLVAAETHLTDYMQDIKDVSSKDSSGNDFCVECLAKHALAISQFAQEGTQFFKADPYFNRVYDEGVSLYKDLPTFDSSKAKKHYDKLRDLRKEMVSRHLLLNAIANEGSNNHFNGNHVSGGYSNV